jgi:hypothetical protein
MSVATWIGEFIDTTIYNDLKEIIKITIKKFKGFRKENLKKHGIDIQELNMVIDFWFYCAFCQNTTTSMGSYNCAFCLLRKKVGVRCIDTLEFRRFYETRDPEEIIEALEKWLKELK